MSYVGKEVDINNKYELVGAVQNFASRFIRALNPVCGVEARDFTDGLQYLHNMEPPVAHGNLTPVSLRFSYLQLSHLEIFCPVQRDH